MDIIRVENLCKSYRMGGEELRVLKGVTLSIRAGDLVALTGSSGSGKSTLMNVLGCLDRPTSGSYRLEGSDVSAATPEQRARIRGARLGFVFQNFNLLPRTTAIENVMLPAEYSRPNRTRRQVRERAEHLLERVGLADRMRHEPSQMSGGQQQRVAIARALVNEPALLLADEPTGNLDSNTSRDILDLFRQLSAEQGLTVLLVTHDPAVAGHARRNIRMRDGQILEDTAAGAAPT